MKRTNPQFNVVAGRFIGLTKWRKTFQRESMQISMRGVVFPFLPSFEASFGTFHQGLSHFPSLLDIALWGWCLVLGMDVCIILEVLALVDEMIIEMNTSLPMARSIYSSMLSLPLSLSN